MSNRNKSRNIFALILSGTAHVTFALLLLAIPKEKIKRYDIVDMSVLEPAPKEKSPTPALEEAATPETPEPAPEIEKVAVEKKAEKPKAKAKKKTVKSEPPPPPPAPAEEKAPEAAAPEAPPTFDLGDNTFAMGNGAGASWSLKRSEGNTRFAGVAQKGQPSLRHTKPIRSNSPAGVPGGTGKGNLTASARPVPLQNLSKRPRPLDRVTAPPYPAESKKAGMEGPVVLKVFIDKKGRVKKTQVVQSPDKLLAKAAQSAMGKVMWTPPLDKMGRPVDTVIVWRFRFVLDG